MESPGPRDHRALFIVLGVVGALVIAAVVIVLTKGAPMTRDESTPEGVVQRYSAAVIAGDEDAAKQYLVAALADDCNRVQGGPVHDMRVTLVDSVVRDDSADVRVLITTTSGGGILGPDEYQEDAAFDLVRSGGQWRIETAPWSLTVCDPMSVAP